MATDDQGFAIISFIEWKRELDEKLIEIIDTEFNSSTKIIFDDEARIKFILSKLLINEEKIKKSKSLEIIKPSIISKTNTFAKKCMVKGIIEDKQGEFDKSYYSYTKGIANAKPETALLSALYFRRSIIFHSHGLFYDCLNDSERALKNLVPNVRFKNHLCFQMANCHEELAKWYLSCSIKFLEYSNRKDLPHKLYENKIFYESSKNMYKWGLQSLPPFVKAKQEVLPEFTDALEIKFTEELGKHVIATRDIKPGELLCVEKAYGITVNQKLRYNICSYCKLQTWSSIPCEKCVHVIYCSVECRDNAYNEHHDIECKVVPLLLPYGIQGKFLMALRLTIIAVKEVNKSIDAMQLKTLIIDKYKSLPIFNEFNTASSNMVYDNIYTTAPKYSPHLIGSQSLASCIIIAYFYGVEIKLFEEKKIMSLQTLANDKSFLFLVQFIETNMRIANFNSLSMSMPSIARDKSIKISNAIFAYSNLFPHSCRQMIAYSLHNNRISIRSTCWIKKGEQVFDNHGVYLDDFDKEARQELMKNLNYICKCKACGDNGKILSIKKDTVPAQKDLEDDQRGVEALRKQIDILNSYRGRQYSIDDDCLKLCLQLIALKQVPYMTLKDINTADNGYNI